MSLNTQNTFGAAMFQDEPDEPSPKPFQDEKSDGEQFPFADEPDEPLGPRQVTPSGSRIMLKDEPDEPEDDAPQILGPECDELLLFGLF